MGILGALPGDFWKCLDTTPHPLGSHAEELKKEACRRIIFGYYLFPQLQRELENLKLWHLEVPVPPKPPFPDPPPIMEELVPALLVSYLSEGKLRPSFSAEIRIETTKVFRDGLQNVVSQLDEQISGFEQKSTS